jgi:hypothetical protein
MTTQEQTGDLRNKEYSSMFSGLWHKFTQHYDDFMSDKKGDLNDIFETAKNNYEYLKQKGYEGTENVSEQLKESKLLISDAMLSFLFS